MLYLQVWTEMSQFGQIFDSFVARTHLSKFEQKFDKIVWRN